jgi:hypothetical protein
MHRPASPLARRALVFLVACSGALGVSTALAQFPQPPSTFFGSVADSTGVVPEGLPVEAYVGEKLCGKGFTQFTGEGDAKVTVWFAGHRFSRADGRVRTEVRIKIGDWFAPDGLWRSGPVQVNVTFGHAGPDPDVHAPPPYADAAAAGTWHGRSCRVGLAGDDPPSPALGRCGNAAGGPTSSIPDRAGWTAMTA